MRTRFLNEPVQKLLKLAHTERRTAETLEIGTHEVRGMRDHLVPPIPQGRDDGRELPG